MNKTTKRVLGIGGVLVLAGVAAATMLRGDDGESEVETVTDVALAVGHIEPRVEAGNAELAAERLEVARVSYEEGLRTFDELQDFIDEERRAEEQLARERYEYPKRWADLEEVAGPLSGVGGRQAGGGTGRCPARAREAGPFPSGASSLGYSASRAARDRGGHRPPRLPAPPWSPPTGACSTPSPPWPPCPRSSPPGADNEKTPAGEAGVSRPAVAAPGQPTTRT